MDARSLLSAKDEKVYIVQSHQTGKEAVCMLVANNIGILVVSDTDGKLVGILSERDVLKGLDQHDTAVTKMCVGDLHTRRLVTCLPGDSLVDLMCMMDSNRIRHLPVVEDEEVLGVISIRDVMSAWLQEIENENQKLLSLVSV